MEKTKLVDLKQVLKLVNKARVAMGIEKLYKLPKGEQDMATTCPLANALEGANVDTDYIGFWEKNESVMRANAVKHAWNIKNSYDSKTVKTPSLLQRFVTQFDDGKFPKLIKR